MDEILELTLDTDDGIADCRLEPQRNDTELFYSATILYPHVVNGYSRSEIFCHDLRRTGYSDEYLFEHGTDIHPKIKKLETQLSDAIKQLNHKK